MHNNNIFFEGKQAGRNEYQNELWAQRAELCSGTNKNHATLRLKSFACITRAMATHPPCICAMSLSTELANLCSENAVPAKMPILAVRMLGAIAAFHPATAAADAAQSMLLGSSRVSWCNTRSAPEKAMYGRPFVQQFALKVSMAQ